MGKRAGRLLVCLVCAVLVPATSASGAAMLRLPGCTANTLPANDDGSTATAVPLGFGVNIDQNAYDTVWVNNNGNVTFDGPLVQYTPSPIAATNHVIIAPYWADVDTRGAGSAVVTYGTTTYNGEPAFCVEWDGVGYYSAHTDKLNNFELLLVSRPDRASGDFDVIFNYDRVQWETGDASGGSNGFGGTPSRVGWSLGNGGNVELPGSGISGAFVDDGPDALAQNNRGSTTPGRYVFPVHGGQAPAARFVALGDSYSSGEGVPPFISGTDTSSDSCHRSNGAYSELLGADPMATTVPPKVEFWACSGAIIPDFYKNNHASGESPQLSRLAPGDATLVTLSIGGNDIGFAGIGAKCLSVQAAWMEQNSQYTADCRNSLDSSTMSAIQNLGVRSPFDASHGLGTLFADIRAQAPLADVYVMGYPRVLPANPTSDCKAQAYRENGSKATASPWGTVGPIGLETKINKDDVAWMDKVVSRLNGEIAIQAANAGFHFVDNENAFQGHDVCNNNTDPSNRPWAHGLVLFDNSNSSPPNPSAWSFHPNAFGQQAMESNLVQAINGGSRPTVEPAQASIVPVVVSAGQALLNILTHWPGSDTDTTLVSPSGTVYTASTPGITHSKTATSENYVIPNPEPGTWQVRVYGTNVNQGGEPVRVDSSTMPAVDVAPVAVIGSSSSAGIAPMRVKFDGLHSSGTASSVARYRWTFGDGSAAASGAGASHTYRRAGTYTATLTVTDTAGRTDTATRTIVVYRRDQRPTASLVLYSNRAQIFYDATGSADRDGQRVTLKLQFGDGGIASRASGYHRYRFKGVYRLRLIATDTRGLRGSARASAVVTSGRSFLTRLRLARRFGSAGGTVITFSAARDGTVMFTVFAARPGKVAHGKCVAGASSTPGRRCVAYRFVGRFSAPARRGANRVAFAGRIGHRRLLRGEYSLQVVGMVFQFTSAPVTRAFGFTG